jgi:hypothetical protein
MSFRGSRLPNWILDVSIIPTNKEELQESPLTMLFNVPCGYVGTIINPNIHTESLKCLILTLFNFFFVMGFQILFFFLSPLNFSIYFYFFNKFRFNSLRTIFLFCFYLLILFINFIILFYYSNLFVYLFFSFRYLRLFHYCEWSESCLLPTKIE